MHIKKEALPVAIEGPGTIFRMQGGLGNMVIAFWEMPAGPEDKALFEGLPTNSCHCPHWGYIVKGQMTLQYDNGENEVVKAGDVFYAPAGHTGKIDEDIAVIEFSPEKEYMEVMTHVGKKMQAME
jgi:hypothetical protein